MGAFKRERKDDKAVTSSGAPVPPSVQSLFNTGEVLPPQRNNPVVRKTAPAPSSPRRRAGQRRRKGNRSISTRPGTFTPAPGAGSNPKALPFTAHRSLVASASLVDLSTAEARTKFARRRATAQGWQDEAWAYVDSIGEIKYAFGLVANTLSRVRLYAGVVEDPALAPAPADLESRAGAAATAAISRLDSAFGGIPGLLRDAALNLQIAGECNLVQIPSDPFRGTPESWDIRSTDELQMNSEGKAVITPTSDGDLSSAIILPDRAFKARIWRPHPRFSDEPDSSMRALLDTCAELLLLNKTFRATARSRLNSGLLYLPDGLSVAATGDPDIPNEPEPPTEDELNDPEYDPSLVGGVDPGVLVDDEDLSDTDDIEEALLEAMTTPIADEESASAVVPLLLRGPADLGEKIRYIQFERSFDPALAERADRVLDRLMQGLDVPKDVVQGLANIKYSNAVVIDQSLYTSHIEPLALLICDALTSVYLRPSLRAAGIPEEEVRKHCIWYDAANVTTRPNKADDADQGFQNYGISWETWRRTHNFTEADAPTPNEVATRMLIEKGPLTPELAEALLAVVAPEVMEAVRQASQAGNPAPLPVEVAEALGGGDAASTPDGTEPPANTPAEESPIPADQLPFEDTPDTPAAQPLNPEDLI